MLVDTVADGHDGAGAGQHLMVGLKRGDVPALAEENIPNRVIVDVDRVVTGGHGFGETAIDFMTKPRHLEVFAQALDEADAADGAGGVGVRATVEPSEGAGAVGCFVAAGFFAAASFGAADARFAATDAEPAIGCGLRRRCTLGFFCTSVSAGAWRLRGASAGAWAAAAAPLSCAPSILFRHASLLRPTVTRNSACIKKRFPPFAFNNNR